MSFPNPNFWSFAALLRRLSVAALACMLPSMAFADTSADLKTTLPDEYESVGDHVLGLGNAGMAASAGIGSLRLNPAMLAMEPTYAVSAGYHWPRSGRDFFQAGVLDSKTSPVAAAFSYTGFSGVYDPSKSAMINEQDSPVLKRASVGVAQAFKSFSAGLSGHFVEAAPLVDPNDPLVKGWSLGLGVATLLTSTIRIGISAENLANAKIADYAPRTLRAGGALIFGGGDLTAHLDFRQRDRVEQLEASLADPIFGLDKTSEENPKKLQPEQMLIGSFSARVYDVVRILGAYGQSVNDDRRLLAGGVAIVNNQVSLSYGASREDLRNQKAHQAVNLNLAISL